MQLQDADGVSDAAHPPLLPVQAGSLLLGCRAVSAVRRPVGDKMVLIAFQIIQAGHGAGSFLDPPAQDTAQLPAGSAAAVAGVTALTEGPGRGRPHCADACWCAGVMDGCDALLGSFVLCTAATHPRSRPMLVYEGREAARDGCWHCEHAAGNLYRGLPPLPLPVNAIWFESMTAVPSETSLFIACQQCSSSLFMYLCQ